LKLLGSPFLANLGKNERQTNCEYRALLAS
jgi:hypothetical protein